mmetsp:Transcript_10743/g.33471  ORF Transcript_10743/g.33471 Transcript_10743/m.33471 type:complete len:370 (+) Transcript_10743:18-1127(+)
MQGPHSRRSAQPRVWGMRACPQVHLALGAHMHASATRPCACCRRRGWIATCSGEAVRVPFWLPTSCPRAAPRDGPRSLLPRGIERTQRSGLDAAYLPVLRVLPPMPLDLAGGRAAQLLPAVVLLAMLWALPQPSPVRALDADDRGDEAKPPVAHQEATGQGGDHGGSLVHHLLPHPGPQRMTPSMPLDVRRRLPGTRALRIGCPPSAHTPCQRLHLLRRTEALPRTLKLGTRELALHSTHAKPGMPTPHVALQQSRAHLPPPDLLVAVLPRYAPTVATPTPLDFHHCPELLLSAHGLPPKLQPAHAASQVALHGEDLVLSAGELTLELEVLLPCPGPEPGFPHKGGCLLHVPEPQLPQLVHPLPGPAGP